MGILDVPGYTKAETDAAIGLVDNKVDAILRSNGTPDQTARVQTALTDAFTVGGGRVALVGAFSISAPLVVDDNTIFDTRRATVTLIAGSNCNMLRLASVASLRSITGTMTATSAVVTSAAGTFTTADIGRSLVVPEAGPVTNNAETGTGLRNNAMTGIVTAVAGDGSTATLSRPAIQSVTAATITVHKRTKNVTLELGVWDRVQNTGVNTNLHSIFLRRGDGIRLKSLDYRSQFNASNIGGKYGVSYGDMIDFIAGEEGLRFTCNSDGIHGLGPLKDVKVQNVTGTTGDDVCVAGISDYVTYAEISGPIENIVFEKITAHSQARAVLLTANVRSDYTITGAVVRTIRGDTQAPFVRLTGSNDLAGDISGHEGIPFIVLEDIQGAPLTVYPLLSLNGRIGIVQARGLYLQTVTGNGGLFQVDEVSRVRRLSITGWGVPTGRAGHIGQVPLSSELNQLEMGSADVTFSGTPNLFYGAGKVDRFVLRDYVQSGGRGMDLRRDVSVCEVTLDNVRTDVPIVRVSGGSTVITAFASNTVYSGTSEGLLRVMGGTPSLMINAGPGVASVSGKLMSRSGTQRLRANGLTARQSVSEITPEPGDIMFNTDTAHAVGVGPCVFDLTTNAWKSLGTAGAAGSLAPPTSGLSGQPVNAEVLTDLFGRTAADVVGTLPDVGGIAYTGSVTRWQVAGGRLVKGVNLDALACFVKAPARGDMAATFVWQTGTQEAASVTERLFIKTIDANNGIRIQRTGQSGASLTLSVVIGGVARQLGATVSTAIPASTAPATYPVTMTTVTTAGVTTASATVNGVAFAGGTLTAAEFAALYDATAWGISSTSPNTQIDDLRVTVNGFYV